jgi:hypothetical protein
MLSCYCTHRTIQTKIKTLTSNKKHSCKELSITCLLQFWIKIITFDSYIYEDIIIIQHFLIV